MKKTNRVTIVDIAKHLGYSVSTVQRAVSDAPYDIDSDTRRKILEYANEVGYTPIRPSSIKARIGILWNIDAEKTPLLQSIATSFTEYAEKNRFSVQVFSIDDNIDYNDLLASNKLSGALLLGVKYKSVLYRKLEIAKSPIVVLNCPITSNKLVANVNYNETLGISDAIDYLVSLGHTNIGFIGDESDKISNAKKLSGYIIGLQGNSIPYRYDYTFFGDSSQETGRRAAEFFLMYDKPITAAILCTEQLAKGFIGKMKTAMFQIPETFSVIGYCTSELPRIDPLPFTVIAPDPNEIGKQSVELIKNLMRGFRSIESSVPCVLIGKEKSCTLSPKKRGSNE